MEVDGGTKEGVGGGAQGEIVKIESQTAISPRVMIFAKSKKTGLRIGLFDLRSKVPMLLYIIMIQKLIASVVSML